jgi:hypothetical protein
MHKIRTASNGTFASHVAVRRFLLAVVVHTVSGCAQLVGTPPDGATNGVDGASVDPFDPGAPCASAEECAGVGVVCEQVGSPDGYCTRPCSGAGTECGTLGVCVRGTCRRRCPQLSDCRNGSALFVCASVSGQMVCLPKCTNDPASLCGEWYCQSDNGLCATTCAQFLPNDVGCSPGSSCSARTGGICRCRSGTNCGAGRTCNTTTGVCQAQ